VRIALPRLFNPVIGTRPPAAPVLGSAEQVTAAEADVEPVVPG
jgi:hypothetical protein